MNDVRRNKDIVKVNGPGGTMSPTEVTRRTKLLPTMIDEGMSEFGG
jgi:hypothetical protein